MEEKEISLKELFNVVWKGKWIIIICAAAVAIVGTIGGMIYDTRSSQVTTIVTLQWSGIASGSYPDGSQFDYSDAIEPHVITSTIDELGLELGTHDVVSALSMKPIVPSDVSALIQSALEDGEQLSYFATDYRLTLDNGALDISVDEGSELLYELIEQYRLDFERRYIRQSILLDYTGADFETVDYLDISDILNTQSNMVQSVIELKYNEHPDFVSPTLGFGFNDILVRTQLIERIELDQIESRTNTFLLSKDPNYLVTKYLYSIERKTFDLETLQLQVIDAQNLVDNYTGSTQTILIPGMDLTDAIVVDTYYDTLLSNLIDIQNAISSMEKDIEYLELQVSRLEGTDPTYTVTPAQQATEEIKVETAIISADEKLASVVEDSNIILTEYNDYISSNIIKSLMTPQYQSNVSVMMITAVSLVLGAGIATVVVLFKHDWE